MSRIARGTLTTEHGKTKQTTGKQSTYATWWAYDGLNREVLFAIVRAEG